MQLCVVAHDVELVSELREIGLDSFSDLAKRLIEWFPILLIEAIRHLESDACTLKQIQLHFGTQISLIPNDCAWKKSCPASFRYLRSWTLACVRSQE